jgi:tRNA(Arg) A34 adenosine deaminase TadA
MDRPGMELRLPAWVGEVLSRCGDTYFSQEDRMGLVLRLAEENARRATGGPFAAAVFEVESGRLVAPGVNMVVPARCSSAHAEIVALSAAQQRLGTFDLGAAGLPAHELVASAEPCAMCMGAVPWSGVRRLVCGARGDDVCCIGFDEGAKPADWVRALKSRGIEVRRDVLRAEAAAILQRYAAAGGQIYNGSRAGAAGAPE